MRDALFGSLGDISGATKDTIAYSADSVDTGALGSRPDKRTTPGDLHLCVRIKTTMESVDSWIFHIQTDSASAFDSAPKLYSFPQTAAALPAETVLRYRVPNDIERYVRAAGTPKSTGTFTANVVEAWFELGPNKS